MAGTTIDLLDEAAALPSSIAEITGQTVEEAVSDVFRTFLWILYEQLHDRKIVSINGGPPRELENFIRDPHTTKKFFKKLGWPVG